MTRFFDRLRTVDGGVIGLAVCAVFAGCVLAVGFAVQSDVTRTGLAVGGLLALAVVARRVPGSWRHFLMATALVGQAVVLSAVLAGHPLQDTAHTAFFVLLAVVAVSGHRGALAWACGLAAAHHVSVSLFAPHLAFASADVAQNLLVSGVYTVLFAAEGVLLAVMMRRKSRGLDQLRRSTDKLRVERQIAEDAREEAQEAQAQMQEVMDALRIGLSRLAGRDLSFGIQTPFPEPYEILRTEFNETVEMLREAFITASNVSEQVAGDSQDLAQAVTGLTAMTTDQAKVLAEMNDTTSALVETLGQTAEQAKEAAHSAGVARDSAVQGGEVTTEAIAAMRGIEDSSRQISRIVDLIDDVSFQTNLLALNAGVEAARAGESGKGFAVVASEVRQLAQSTSEAANGIKKLISDSSDQVATGADLVDAVGQRLEEIKAQISRASDLTTSISARNESQSVSVVQLHDVVKTTAGETQRAVTSGEGLAVTTRRMAIRAKKLSCDMEAFTLTEAEMLGQVAQG